jgi:hypothetical protein
MEQTFDKQKERRDLESEDFDRSAIIQTRSVRRSGKTGT